MTELSKHLANLSPEQRERLWQQLKSKNGAAPRLQIQRQQRDTTLFPLSFAQQRLWFLDQLEPGNSIYNIPTALRLQGQLNVTALVQSLSEISRRHEILRTSFTLVNGQPMQRIVPPEPFTLAQVDLLRQEDQLSGFLAREAQKPFDLAQDRLLRATLIHLGPQDHVLLLIMHHIISDGWSISLFFQELSSLYNAFSMGQPPVLTELPLQYADFAAWQRQWLQGDTLAAQLAYWKKHLEGAPAILELPADHPRPAVQTYQGASESVHLSPSLTEALKRLSQQEGATLFMTLLAAFKTLLYRYTGQEDLVIGTPIANRNRLEIEQLIGFFINTLVLRSDLSGQPSFRDLLRRVREVALGAYAHQDLPVEKLVEELHPERDLSHTPLFQVWFVLQNTPDQVLNLATVKVTPVEVPVETAKFDLSLALAESAEGLVGTVDYNVALFEPLTIQRLVRHFQTLLEGVVANPDQAISDIALLSLSDRQQLAPTQSVQPTKPFVEFTAGELGQSIPARFDQQARQYPHHEALKTKKYTWTYQALSQEVDRIAGAILGACGAGEEKIAILFDHDAPMIAALLGALKAGKTYVPLDPAYPEERLAYILADSQAGALITNNLNLALAQKLTSPEIRLINIDRLESASEIAYPAVPPERIAYLLYTSGSTGQPKGVMQSHRNVLHHIRTYTNNLHIAADDRLTLLSSYSFDAAVMDIFGALLNGATLYPINLKEVGFAELSRQLLEQNITIYHSTPTVYRYFMGSLSEGQLFPRIRLVVLGGEEVYKRDIDLYRRHFSPDCLFVNGLGPTESTVTLQYFLNHQTQIGRNSVPVGYPVTDTEVLLLNEAGREAGVYGEIAIRSPYIALGYWQKPEITAASFLTDPEGSGQWLYRTGDMGYLRPDGALEFIGRRDFQVKIRGFRIELKEIEAALSQHPAVRETVVVAREDSRGEKYLVAYIVPHQMEESLADDWRDFLSARLPLYMIPATFITVAALPLTPSGKIDRRALPAPDQVDLKPAKSFTLPRNSQELQLLQLWSQLLGLQTISIHDNFFELGGHSLLAVRLLAQIEAVFGQQIPLTTLFQAPTIAQLAQVLRDAHWSPPWSSLVALQPAGSRPSFFCIPGNLGNVFVDLSDLARHLGPDQPFYGLQDGIQNPAQIDALACHYLNEIRTVQPNGPYFLGGVCSGGIIAFEIAQQLLAQGQPVALLALIEPPRPPMPGLQTYFNFSAVLLRRFVQRFAHHTRILWQDSSPEQGSYTRLKAKLLANLWAMVRYAPRPYPGQITLFLGEESMIPGSQDPRMGWQSLAMNGLDIHFVPGSHNTITRTHEAIPPEADIRVLAEQLRQCLDQASANTQKETARS